MNLFRSVYAWAVCVILLMGSHLHAQMPFDEVVRKVNQRTVKLFGSGGYSGLVSYGTGMFISSKGHILTVATQLLDTQDLRIHTYDGRRLRAKVLVIEPELDAAILEIKKDPMDTRELNVQYFDVQEAAQKLKTQPGDWVLSFCNCFEIATRDEPVSVQRGVVSAFAKLVARRGIQEAPFNGEVFFLDAVTNNPGSAGGPVTTRKGELIGMIGKEYRNVQSDTWSNYAIPINCKIEIKQGTTSKMISLPDFVEKGMKGEWKPTVRETAKRDGPGAYHGIIFVPNLLERTPPYIDAVEANSPAAKAGLKPDDLVVYLEGEPVYSIKSFREMMSKTKPDMTVKIEIRRGEKLTAVELKLTDYPKR